MRVVCCLVSVCQHSMPRAFAAACCISRHPLFAKLLFWCILCMASQLWHTVTAIDVFLAAEQQHLQLEGQSALFQVSGHS